MRHVLISIAIVALAASACGKGDKTGESASNATAPPAGTTAAAPPPAPYEGALTAERMKQAKDATKPFQKWDEAHARLLGTVGKPASVEGNTSYWYLLVGDKCHELSVENNDGEVGAVGLGEYDKVMKSKFDKCKPTAADADDEDDDGDDEDEDGDKDDDHDDDHGTADKDDD